MNIDLFELINKYNFENNCLSIDELFLYRRNIAFIPIFESLFNQTHINFYLKKIGNDFDADYIQFCYYNGLGGYLGIIGSDKNNYHYFNSIMLEYDDPEKYIGPKVIVKKVIKTLKSDFQYENYKMVQSKRFIQIQKQKKVKKQNQLKSILSNNDRKTINKLLKNDLKIEKGEYGKKSLKIVKANQVLEKGIKLDLKKLDSPEKIAEFINENYDD